MNRRSVEVVEWTETIEELDVISDCPSRSNSQPILSSRQVSA